ncbi:MAG: SMI1/KNR4 family protein [Turicibacter sp.]|nr:SMI1/KNR4 family protein [Turicibacter sp.]
MKTMVEILKDFGDLVSLSPVSEEEIERAEERLSLKFAAEYREYLAEFGAAAAGGHEFTGIVKSERLNVVSVTLREWGLNPEISRNMYVVENVGIDGVVVWQEESGQVFRSVIGGEIEVIAAGLAEWLV